MTYRTCRRCEFTLFLPLMSLEHSRVGIYDDARFPGRLLLVLNEHYEHLDEVPAEKAASFLGEIQQVSARMREALDARRINVSVLGNAEPHVHAHLIPRYDSDPAPTRSPWDDPRPRVKMSPTLRIGLLDTLGAALDGLVVDSLLIACDWPGCTRRHIRHLGPQDDPGWRQKGGFWGGTMLCPSHSATEHWPGAAGQRPKLVVTCGCGARLGRNPANGIEARAMWKGHLAGLGLIG